MITKTCCMCKQELPIDSFSSSKMDCTYSAYKTQSTGLVYEGRCKPCKAAYAREWRKQHRNYKGTGKITRIPKEDRLLVSAISSRFTQMNQRIAKYKLEPTDIDRDHLYQLFKDQDGKCALTGVKMKIEKFAVTCLSLDKIDPMKGYVKGNVQWVAWAANRAKGDMSQDMFVDMCKQVIEYQKVQRLSNSSES